MKNLIFSNKFSFFKIKFQTRCLRNNFQKISLFSTKTNSFKKINFFFGSQTGTSQSFANQLAEEGATQRHFETKVIDLNQYKEKNVFSKDDLNVFVLSTYGEGEPTDNAKNFFKWIQEEKEKDTFKDLPYAV